MNAKRITIFCGHYGSGKTNVAVNFALKLKQVRDEVSVLDLDIVNPYFRTKDSLEDLKAAGIRLIASQYANSNVAQAKKLLYLLIVHDLFFASQILQSLVFSESCYCLYKIIHCSSKLCTFSC